MKIKIFIMLIVLFSLKYFIIQNRTLTKTNSEMINLNPLFLRVISPFFNDLIADKLWFLTNKIGEFSKKKFNQKKFVKSFKNIIILNPKFTTATLYSSIYLASMQNNIKSALELIKLNRKLNKNNLELIYSELIFRIVYKKHNDILYLKSLAKELIKKMDNKIIKIGKLGVNSLINDIITHLKNKSITQEIRQKDKFWLKKLQN